MANMAKAAKAVREKLERICEEDCFPDEACTLCKLVEVTETALQRAEKEEPRLSPGGPWEQFAWYKQIEPEIREVVWLLRNHGINTTSSCGHEMYVAAYCANVHEVEQAYKVLHKYGYQNFAIEYTMERVTEPDPQPRSYMVIWILDKHGRRYPPKEGDGGEQRLLSAG